MSHYIPPTMLLRLSRLRGPYASVHPFLKSAGDVEVVPMKYSYLSKAAQTWIDAFEDDPLFHYIRDTPDFQRGPYYKKGNQVVIQGYLALTIHQNIALTVSDGAAIILASYAQNSPSAPRGPVDRLVDFMGRYYLQALGPFSSGEQRKRNEEVKSKTNAVVEKVIGERLDDMLYVGALATEPASQGNGYGGALLDAVTEIADSQARAIWLTSSNIVNTEFYNWHGFQTVGETLIGDANPTWTEPPFIISIMVREPATRGHKY